MDIIMDYGIRISNPTIYDRILDVVEIYDKWGNPEGIELFARVEVGPNIELCSVSADECGNIGPDYPVGNAANYRIIERNISWCDAKIHYM